MRKGTLIAVIAVVLAAAWIVLGPKPGASKEEEQILPVEDLMREHGVLRRILLIYEEAARRAEKGERFPDREVIEAAGIIRDFIEGYHEKLEEEYIFPLFKGSERYGGLTPVLEEQHRSGRRLTGDILFLAENVSGNSGKIVENMRSFIRMYRPHAAREDTVLFPAVASAAGARRYKELGDKFEAIEGEKFGENGFGKMVERTAEIERKLGIQDLARFTPE